MRATHTGASTNLCKGCDMATKAKRAKRKGVKSGGESPCKRCSAVKLTPARNRKGQFAKKARKR
jgi:hypothetical protein